MGKVVDDRAAVWYNYGHAEADRAGAKFAAAPTSLFKNLPVCLLGRWRRLEVLGIRRRYINPSGPSVEESSWLRAALSPWYGVDAPMAQAIRSGVVGPAG